MRFSLLLLLSLPGLVLAEAPADEQLLRLVRERTTALEEVTREPVKMQALTMLLCNIPSPELVAEEKGNPHVDKFARLFVDKTGRPAAEGREPRHPEGAVLLKEKLPAITQPGAGKSQAGTAPELFTGMVKREKGYNPDCGDWEFFTVSGDGGKVTSRGKLESCMECHRRYPRQDFVTRYYVPERRMVPGADGTVLLHSRDAWVLGNNLRYEPQPNKNTLGYWSIKEDTAAWQLAIPRAGRYEVEVLQGCGKGSGGAEVRLEVVTTGLDKYAQATPLATLSFTVEDTGHFQNFKARKIGIIDLPASEKLSLRVVPQTKPGGAVMDLRQITLHPVQ